MTRDTVWVFLHCPVCTHLYTIDDARTLQLDHVTSVSAEIHQRWHTTRVLSYTSVCRAFYLLYRSDCDSVEQLLLRVHLLVTRTDRQTDGQTQAMHNAVPPSSVAELRVGHISPVFSNSPLTDGPSLLPAVCISVYSEVAPTCRSLRNIIVSNCQRRFCLFLALKIFNVK